MNTALGRASTDSISSACGNIMLCNARRIVVIAASPGIVARARKAMVQDAIAAFRIGSFEGVAGAGRVVSLMENPPPPHYRVLPATFFSTGAFADLAFAGAFGFAAAFAGLARAVGAAAGSTLAGFAAFLTAA